MKKIHINSFYKAAFLLALVTTISDTTFAQVTDDTPQYNNQIYCPNLVSTFKLGYRDANTGGQVSELQQFLADYFNLDPDLIISGIFGNKTLSYVKTFQSALNLPSYGIIGTLTRSAISGACQGGVTPPLPPTGTSTTPIIYSVSTSTVTSSSIQINWSTNVPTTGRVDYGPTASYGSFVSTTTLSSTHNFTLSNLDLNLAYHFKITSIDVSNNSTSTIDMIIPSLEYFVDSQNGNDSNNGLSPSTAIRTIARLTTIDNNNPLSTWNLAKGSTWREKLVVPRNNMTIQSYGEGTLPLLDASEIIQSTAWTKTPGYNNIYQATLTQDSLDSGAAWTSMWENNVRLMQASSLAELDYATTTAKGAYYTSSNTKVESLTYYIKPKNGLEPTNNSVTYEYAKRASGLTSIYVENTTIKDISARRNFLSYGSIGLGRGAKAYNIQASDGNTHNIFMMGNSEIYGCTADSGYAFQSVIVPVVWYEENPKGANIKIDNCTSKTDYINPYGFVGFLGHAGSGKFGTTTISNSFAIDSIQPTNPNYGSAGFEAEDGVALILTNATATNMKYAIKSGINTIARNVDMVNAIQSSSYATFGQPNIYYDIDGANITMLPNINMLNIVQSSQVNNKLTIKNVKMSTPTPGKGAIFVIKTSQPGASVTSMNNTFQPNNGGSAYVLAASTVLNSDYNTFLTNGFFTIGTTTYSNIQQYKTATGQDSHSTP